MKKSRKTGKRELKAKKVRGKPVYIVDLPRGLKSQKQLLELTERIKIQKIPDGVVNVKLAHVVKKKGESADVNFNYMPETEKTDRAELQTALTDAVNTLHDKDYYKEDTAYQKRVKRIRYKVNRVVIRFFE